MQSFAVLIAGILDRQERAALLESLCKLTEGGGRHRAALEGPMRQENNGQVGSARPRQLSQDMQAGISRAVDRGRGGCLQKSSAVAHVAVLFAVCCFGG